MRFINNTGKMSAIAKARYEKKFLVENEKLKNVLEKLAEKIPPKKYAGKCKSQVFSMYFDSPDFFAYGEHKRGKNERFKLRFRAYDEDITPATIGYLELKQKQDEVSYKYRTRMHFGDVQDLLQNKQPARLWEKVLRLNGDRDAWKIFHMTSAFMIHYDFMPKTIVRYERMSFEDEGSTHRITIDTNIDFLPVIRGKMHSMGIGTPNNNSFVLESKTPTPIIPSHFIALVEDHGIYETAFSKYIKSVEVLNLIPKAYATS